MTIEYIPLSAKREEVCTGRFSYAFVEAALDYAERTVTFTRVLSEDAAQSFTLSLEDLDELFAAYDALVTGAPSESASEINERGVAQLQRPRHL